MKAGKLIPTMLVFFLLAGCVGQATPTADLPTPIATISPAPTEAAMPQAPTVDVSQGIFTISFDDRSLFELNLNESSQAILNGLPGASIYHVALSLSDPPTNVKGVEEVRYTNTETVALDRVDFAIYAGILGGSIEVTNVRVNNEPVMPVFQTSYLSIPLAVPIQPGESTVFALDFEVNVPTKGGNYYGIFAYTEGILSLTQAIPTILVYNEEGWNNQIPNLNGDPLFADMSFYLVSVDAPADLTLIASGSEVERSEADGRQQVLFANGPARDFYLNANRGLVRLSDTVNGITVNSYAREEDTASGQVALDTTLASIDLFSDLYGPYPYAEFDIVPIGSPMAVEYPGLAAVSLSVYKSSGNNSSDMEGISHEVAHQWFYNLVGNDTQDQPWLDEALAMYLMWEYFHLYRGDEEADYYETMIQTSWQNSPNPDLPIGMPVKLYGSTYLSIVYNKGFVFLTTLRDQMGQAKFDEFMRDYVATYAWDIATTDGFKALAEQHCNCDLTALFDEWVYQ